MRKRLVAVLGTAALVAAGCGDDDKESGSASESLTKAEYIAKADGICREVNTATKPFEDKLDALNEDSDVSELAPILEGGLAEERKGRDRLRELPAPSEDKATLDDYYVTADKTLDLGAQLEDAAEASDEAKVKQLVDDNEDLDPEQKRLARQYGFKFCGIN